MNCVCGGEGDTGESGVLVGGKKGSNLIDNNKRAIKVDRPIRAG